MRALRVGLTGGIGSGKSTVSRRLSTLGASVVDADLIAREVVEPGTPGLAAIRARFGDGILTSDGTLDRPALGRLVFADAAALRDLEAITHPAIWGRTAHLMDAVPPGRVAVHDMPLLVEKRMSDQYHLVVVVGADVDTRLHRLVALRGMTEADARARIAAQADDEARHAASDVWLVNEGSTADLTAEIDRLWAERLLPFAHHLRLGLRARRSEHLHLSSHDPGWAATADRLLARLRRAGGATIGTADHIGSTAVPGLLAKPVLDLQLGVPSMAAADQPAFVRSLTEAGFPRAEQVTHDRPRSGEVWAKRRHGGCDPAVLVHVHVREIGSPGWRWALLLRDWLRADAAARAEYAAEKRRLLDLGMTTTAYTEAKEPWFDRVDGRARAWAEHTGWQPVSRAD